jgi:hypothetical protein
MDVKTAAALAIALGESIPGATLEAEKEAQKARRAADVQAMLCNQFMETLEAMVQLRIQTIRATLNLREEFEVGTEPYEAFDELLGLMGVPLEASIPSRGNRPPHWAAVERIERQRFPDLTLH